MLNFKELIVVLFPTFSTLINRLSSSPFTKSLKIKVVLQIPAVFKVQFRKLFHRVEIGGWQIPPLCLHCKSNTRQLQLQQWICSPYMPDPWPSTLGSSISSGLGENWPAVDTVPRAPSQGRASCNWGFGLAWLLFPECLAEVASEVSVMQEDASFSLVSVSFEKIHSYTRKAVCISQKTLLSAVVLSL